MVDNMKTLLFYDLDEDGWESVLEDIRKNGVTYLLYQDEEDDPSAVLVSYERFTELTGAQISHHDVKEEQ